MAVRIEGYLKFKPIRPDDEQRDLDTESAANLKFAERGADASESANQKLAVTDADGPDPAVGVGQGQRGHVQPQHGRERHIRSEFVQ